MPGNWLQTLCMSTVVATLATFGNSALADESPKATSKWRVEVDGTAKSDGTVTLRVTPNQAAATDVAVSIGKGRTENQVAQEIRDALSAQLPVGRYEVEVDDGEDVLLKKQRDQPDFVVELVSSSVENVRIEVEHD